jgi:hypothetical protein
MPMLSVYVSDRTLEILTREAEARGRTVQDLASAAVESEVMGADRDARQILSTGQMT